jgi:hypothetical protein
LIGRQRDVDLGTGHVLDGVDGLFEFTLQGLQIVGLLGHARAGDAFLVQKRQTDGAGRRQAGLGQRKPLLIHIAGRHQDGGPTVSQLVGHLVRRQLGGDIGGVGRLEVGEQRGVAGFSGE